jgi:3'-phosphoadenosine 5'-phosphosulfate sulfotransferase (PAPS reductase)/FAD synthetase
MVCRFSCGAASAVATKLILAEHAPEDVLIVNAFIKEEHEDNRRFLADCEQWFGRPITVVRNEKWNASTHDIWIRKKFIINHRHAPCSTELKREVMGKLAQPGDVTVLGFTAEETARFDSLCDRFPDEQFRAPLIEKGLRKEDCLAIIQRAGIEVPMMYRLGYDNANCIGCPKGGQAYWQNIRADFPERFVQIKTIQESIGPGASFLRFRSGPRKNERMSLAELPEGRGDMKKEQSFACSFFCQMAEQTIEDKLPQ